MPRFRATMRRDMSARRLHHPDVCWPVLRRRASGFFLDCLSTYAILAVTGSRPGLLLRYACFPSDRAHEAAVGRLRKAGIVTYRRRGDHARGIALTGQGWAASESLKPERLWNRAWDGRWRVLVYDIAEAEREFRNGLRRLLRRLRMGYLQDSVWVSPTDLRPWYDDLQAALNVQSVSFLFEARTVLGRGHRELVDEAWDFQRLGEAQAAYLSTCDDLLARMRAGRPEDEALGRMIRREMTAYLSVMDRDPLLPRKLLPFGYRGFEVHDEHRRFVGAVEQLAGR